MQSFRFVGNRPRNTSWLVTGVERGAKFMLPLALIFCFFLPTTAIAVTESGLVVCGNASVDGKVPDSEQCTFDLFIRQAQKIINFLIFAIAAPLATVMFAYAGFLYITNGGNESQISHAHEIFWNVFIGLVVALAAWLTINFILVFFLGADSPFNFLTESANNP